MKCLIYHRTKTQSAIIHWSLTGSFFRYGCIRRKSFIPTFIKLIHHIMKNFNFIFKQKTFGYSYIIAIFLSPRFESLCESWKFLHKYYELLWQEDCLVSRYSMRVLSACGMAFISYPNIKKYRFDRFWVPLNVERLSFSLQFSFL